MPAPKTTPHVQVTLRIPVDWLERADALAAALSEPGMEISRTDAMRRALAEGLLKLEERFRPQPAPEPAKPAKRSSKPLACLERSGPRAWCKHAGGLGPSPPERRETMSKSTRIHARSSPKKPLAERFWSKVDQSAGPESCWPWKGGTISVGYGEFYVNEKCRTAYAHRIAYELTHGPILPTLMVCHRCDNPPCVNPAHLFLGTHNDNMADMRAKGRGAEGTRHGSRTQPHRRKLTAVEVQALRLARADGVPRLAVAKRFGVSPATVTRIATGKTWRHVDSGKAVA
jgi:hypothetical protein